jgi:hypothetical protein
MRKIVIISDYFAPQNEVAAIRLTKIAKYIYKTCNCEISVVTRNKDFQVIDKLLAADAECIKEYIKITESKLLVKINEVREKREKARRSIILTQNNKEAPKINLFKKFKNTIYFYVMYLLDLFNNKSYSQQAIKKLRTYNQNYDVIISSFGPMSSHFIGKHIKMRNPSAFWIADFRDAVYHSKVPIGFRSYAQKFAKRICKKADAITTVSKGTMDGLFLDNADNSHIITNGFDYDDLIEFPIIKNSEKRKFNLAYVGELYSGKRKLSPIFKVIRELIDEGIISKDRLEFIYAGKSKNGFISQIDHFGLIDCAVIHDLVPRKKSIEMQLKSDILLLASWNEIGSTGIITGKFLEYMMMKKPIVCTISGNLSGSTLKEMINEANIGVCYEEANDEIDYHLLKKYISEKYYEFINMGSLKFNPNDEYIEKFNYKNIAKQFIKLFDV